MGFFKFLVSKLHIIFLVVFILVLVAYTIPSMAGYIDTTKMQAIFSTPISDAPFGWLAILVCYALFISRK